MQLCKITYIPDTQLSSSCSTSDSDIGAEVRSITKKSLNALSGTTYDKPRSEVRSFCRKRQRRSAIRFTLPTASAWNVDDADGLYLYLDCICIWLWTWGVVFSTPRCISLLSPPHNRTNDPPMHLFSAQAQRLRRSSLVSLL